MHPCVKRMAFCQLTEIHYRIEANKGRWSMQAKRTVATPGELEPWVRARAECLPSAGCDCSERTPSFLHIIRSFPASPLCNSTSACSMPQACLLSSLSFMCLHLAQLLPHTAPNWMNLTNRWWRAYSSTSSTCFQKWSLGLRKNTMEMVCCWT